MERLSRWSGIWKEELDRVEDPFFATSYVRNNLQGRCDLCGLGEFLKDCGFFQAEKLTRDQISMVLRPIERGEWLLLRDEPLRPIDPEHYSGARFCKSRIELQQVAALGLSGTGPGKWKIVNIKFNKLASGAAFLANFLTSRADEGRVFLSSGKDFANTTRTVTQRWVPLAGGEREFSRSSAIHEYGTERMTQQYYVEAEDHWDISGASWHWRPVLANEIYEFKEG